MSFDDKYFSTNAYQDVSFAKYSQYWWSNRFYAILARRYGKRGTRLLEIGSGLGHLVGQLDGRFETAALDVNQWALARSKAVTPRTLLQVASAEDLPFADRSFGVVIIKHVVEHLSHPGRAIAELGRVMAPGGALILSTPNLASLSRPWKGGNWIGYHDPTHISLKPPSSPRPRKRWTKADRNSSVSRSMAIRSALTRRTSPSTAARTSAACL